MIYIETDVQSLVGYSDSVSRNYAYVSTTGNTLQVENFLLTAKNNFLDLLTATAFNILKLGKSFNSGLYGTLVNIVLENYRSDSSSLPVSKNNVNQSSIQPRIK